MVVPLVLRRASFHVAKPLLITEWVHYAYTGCAVAAAWNWNARRHRTRRELPCVRRRVPPPRTHAHTCAHMRTRYSVARPHHAQKKNGARTAGYAERTSLVVFSLHSTASLLMAITRPCPFPSLLRRRRCQLRDWHDACSGWWLLRGTACCGDARPYSALGSSLHAAPALSLCPSYNSPPCSEKPRSSCG